MIKPNNVISMDLMLEHQHHLWEWKSGSKNGPLFLFWYA